MTRLLHRAGHPVAAVISRDRRAAETLAKAVATMMTPVASTELIDLPIGVEALLLAVPDDALPGIVAQLIALPGRDWTDCLVFHSSGARDSSLLAPLAERGALTMSLHPMASFASVPTTTAGLSLVGTTFGLESADPDALALGEKLVHDLGGRVLHVPAHAKPLYHLAGVVASNYLVTLLHLATELLAGLGLRQTEALKVVRPLIEGTLANIQAFGPTAALTGPIARGDNATVELHLTELQRQMPHLVPLYGALAMETVRVAVRKGTLSTEAAGGLLDLLAGALAREAGVERDPPPVAGSGA